MDNSEWLWMSSPRFTVAVLVSRGRVVGGPPIARKFMGQPIGNLRRWMQKQGAFRESVLHNEQEEDNGGTAEAEAEGEQRG